MRILNKNNIFILVHLLCWLILAVGVLYNRPGDWGNNIPKEFWIRQTVLLVILVCVFYVNYYVLIPRLIVQRKVWIYIPVVFLVIYGVTLLNNSIDTIFNLNEFMMNRPHPPGGFHPPGPPHHGRPDRHGRLDIYVVGLNLLMIGLGITVSFIQKWQHEVNLRQQLEREKVNSELTLLKAQINPHFFFNTLNTIYSYTLSDGDIARTAITNLSKMMRYVLYDAEGGQTPLSKEIAFIREYTELMKLRTSKKTSILIDMQERGNEVMIAPMLFLPFVENAFKHGVSSIEEGHISIWVIQHNDSVELIVKNTVYESRRASEDESNGIGILNTTRRLDLLYPGKYTLSTGMINATEYEAKLRLMI
jgi:two-component system LytT family sensor kinase